MQLEDLFNLSFMNGVFPSILKTAKVVPVFKKDSKLDYSNYRPISLLGKYLKNECLTDCITLYTSITLILSITYNLVSHSIILYHIP